MCLEIIYNKGFGINTMVDMQSKKKKKKKKKKRLSWWRKV